MQTISHKVGSHKKKSKRNSSFFKPSFVQPKLTIGEPNDKYEQEADDMADKVMRMPQNTPAIQTKCADCEQEENVQPKRKENFLSLKRIIQKMSSSQEELQTKPMLQRMGDPEQEILQTKPLMMKSESGGGVATSALTSQLNSSKGDGSPLPASTNQFMSNAFGSDFSSVRVHTGSNAIQMNQGLGARAFVHGSDVYFNKGEYSPNSSEGKRLLGHELTHTLQQNTKTSIQSKPAGLQVGLKKIPYDENRLQINEVRDFEVLTVSGGTTKYANLPQSLSAKNNDANVKSLAWELYDPSDVLVPDADLRVKINLSKTTIDKYPVLYSSTFSNNAKEGRYTARCIGKDSADNFIVYAEESFFVRLTESLEQSNLSDLNKIKSNPNKHSLGEVGAAYGRSMMLEHKEAIRNRSVGTIGGNKCQTPQPSGTIEHDCTTYVLDVLEKAFTAKGIKTAWDNIFKDAVKNSNGPFLGTELLKSLVNIGGWKAVFWSPDPRNPDDGLSEHPVAYKKVKAKSTYYGIPVESSKSIVNYRKTSSKSREDMALYDNLKKIPLGIIAAKGGTHMTLIINGVVYEVHWDLPATDANVIEATSLEKWQWNSGVIVIPDSDFKSSFP